MRLRRGWIDEFLEDFGDEVRVVRIRGIVKFETLKKGILVDF
tara:strand:- start:2010 stop:2135 length:126 start_codon:yes stop_codon:yes gene_type:complete